MKNSIILFFLFVSFIIISCSKDTISDNNNSSNSYKIVKEVNYNGYPTKIIIDKPNGTNFNVLMVFHGTVQPSNNHENTILAAAENALTVFRNLLNNKNILIISVAYPQENLLFGDNINYAENALLWLKNQAESELQINIDKIFLAGHSQGGYIVTRLNTLHVTDGVVANAPGPLNLVYRCQQEEENTVASSSVCLLLNENYGSPSQNPNAYMDRSLLQFTENFQSDILFIQGLNDSEIQMYSWPIFKANVLSCTNCQSISFLELQGLGHNALFVSNEAKIAFNTFINNRM